MMSSANRPPYARRDAAVFAAVAAFLVVSFLAATMGPPDWRGTLSLAALAVGVAVMGASVAIARGPAGRLRVGAVRRTGEASLVLGGRDRSSAYLGAGLLAIIASQPPSLDVDRGVPPLFGWLRLLVVVLMLAMMARLIVRARRVEAVIAISPSGITLDLPRFAGEVPWERLAVREPSGPQSRVAFDPPLPARPTERLLRLLGDRPVRDIRLDHLVTGADAVSLAELVEHYRAHPEDRPELTTAQAIQRLRSIEANRWGPPWPPQPRGPRPEATSQEG